REVSFLSVLDDLDPPAPRLEDEVRPRADERVARPALAALDAFQEKGIAVPLEPPEKRERRLEVHEQLLVDGNQVSPLRQAREFFEGRMQHALRFRKNKKAIGRPPMAFWKSLVKLDLAKRQTAE